MAELLTGVPLFTANTEEDMLMQIVDLGDGIISMGLQAFEDILELSLAGREIPAGLLSFNPCEKLTAVEALKHRWFTEEAAAAEPPATAKAEYPGFVPLFSAA
ncbi:uncharacterized protein LOC133923025 [Phragmites australis]|uniref:uncharacterized protein LOC133923025 n=1 Tax=Phragmites australis TaxID=29695 RepID=UPI002D78F75B|nr:uncharacterized protein LOC133923025 [Phragmites australis]